MPTWWKRQTARIDAFVAGGVTACFFWWFGQLLQLWGTVALWAAIFGGLQLLRFVGAQLAELQWVRMHQAILREKAPAPAPARGDGYREAAVVEEPADADDERLAADVHRRGRRAKLSLAVVCALLWGASAVPGLLEGVWSVFGGASLAAMMLAISQAAIYAWRRQEAKRRDYFTRHLERDTQALLEPKRRVADPQVRVGVDFGVPAEQLLATSRELATSQDANEEDPQTRGTRRRS